MNGMMSRVRVALKIAVCVAALLLVCSCRVASASVAILLEEPYGGMSHLNPTGHTALYFDHICAETLIKVRPCRIGEQGVVVSRYDDIADLDWVAMPLLPYLYAVDYSTEIPLSMDRPALTKLRDDYRRAHLLSLVPNLPDGGSPPGNWYELAGSAYDRTIFGFQVKTTPEQDAHMIAVLNDRRNVERYNGAFRNCADFVRANINRLYPHAIRRNYIADFGLTTPKSVARALDRYGRKHPEAELTVFQIPQIPGSLPRSRKPVGVSEGLIKTYGVPMILLSPLSTGIVYAAYLGHGRLSLPKDTPVMDLRTADPALASALQIAYAVPLASTGVAPMTDSTAGQGARRPADDGITSQGNKASTPGPSIGVSMGSQ